MTAFLPAWAVWLTAPKVPPHHLYDQIEIDIKVKVWNFHSELEFLRISCIIKLKLELFGIFILSFVSVFEIFDRVSDS